MNNDYDPLSFARKANSLEKVTFELAEHVCVTAGICVYPSFTAYFFATL